MRFEQVDLTQGGDLTCQLEFWKRDESPFVSILKISFAGTYRDGSLGKPDAAYIQGMLHIAESVHRPSAVVVDLSRLDYQWGDEMYGIIDIENAHRIAFVVGDKCRRALSTLVFGMTTESDITEQGNVFSDLSDAVLYLANHLVCKWNESAAQFGTDPSSKPLSLKEFQLDF